MGEPRDPVAEWEVRVEAQFAALKKFAASCGCSLKEKNLPPPMTAATLAEDCLKAGWEVLVWASKVREPILDRL